MKALQMDVHSGMADDLLPLLEAAWSRAAESPTLGELAMRPDVARVHTLLTSEWDRRMARDSAGAVAFHAFTHFAAANVLEDDIPSIIYERVLEVAPFYVMKIAILALQGRFPAGEGILQGGADELLMRALEQTAQFLTDRFGTVEPEGYAYGDLHLSDFDNAFGLGMPLGRVATDGGEDTVNVAHAAFRRDLALLDEWRSNYGPVERMVASFPTPDGPPRIEIDFPLGNVADPASPHFGDTMSRWVEGDAWPMPFKADEVAAAAESETWLTP